jgi:hypothetical protein
MITLADIDKLMNQFYLESEKDGRAVRPNVVLLTEDQFEELLKEMGVEEDDDITIESILGLDVVIANGIEYPRVIRL